MSKDTTNRGLKMNLKITKTRKYVVQGVYVRKYMYSCLNLDTNETLFRYAFDYERARSSFEKAFAVHTVRKVRICKPVSIPLDKLLNNDAIITNLKN